jgi:hypothetical protein
MQLKMDLRYLRKRKSPFYEILNCGWWPTTCESTRYMAQKERYA